MEQRSEETLSPYRTFSRAEWAALREDTPMTLTSEEVTRLRSLHDRLDIKEVEDIYLSLSRVLWRSENPLPRACCRPYWRAGRTCPRSISSPPTVFFIRIRSSSAKA